MLFELAYDHLIGQMCQITVTMMSSIGCYKRRTVFQVSVSKQNSKFFKVMDILKEVVRLMDRYFYLRPCFRADWVNTIAVSMGVGWGGIWGHVPPNLGPKILEEKGAYLMLSWGKKTDIFFACRRICFSFLALKKEVILYL